MTKENKILYGKVVADKLYEDMKRTIETMKVNLGEETRAPSLIIVTASDDKASQTYVKNKLKRAEEIGIKAEQIICEESTTQEQFERLINSLNIDSNVDGIIIQLPLYKHLDEFKANKLISASKDVDGFGIENTGLLSLGEDGLVSCTPAGVMEMLRYYDIEVEGKNVLIVNRSNIVGKPLAQLMLQANGTVTMAHSRTKNLKEHIERADIICFGIGRAKMFDASYFHSGQTLVDISINRDSQTGKLCGDIDFNDVMGAHENINITPVPGSVGPLTIAMLMQNVVNSWVKWLDASKNAPACKMQCTTCTNCVYEQ